MGSGVHVRWMVWVWCLLSFPYSSTQAKLSSYTPCWRGAERLYWSHCVGLSLFPVGPDGILWTTNHFRPNLVLWCIIMRWSCMWKNLFTIFKVKVTVRAYLLKIWLFLLYLLNCWFVCNQTWYLSTTSYAGVFCEKLDYCIQGQGDSEGSECQWMSRWNLNCQTFCNQTWYCDASSWAGVSCKKNGLLSSRSRSHQRLLWSKYDSFYYIFRTADPFTIKLGLMVHYHMPECLMKKLDCCVQSRDHNKT